MPLLLESVKEVWGTQGGRQRAGRGPCATALQRATEVSLLRGQPYEAQREGGDTWKTGQPSTGGARAAGASGGPDRPRSTEVHRMR